jgi:hypothetical protein
MELEKDALGAAPAARGHEGTPTAVTQPYGALYGRGDVARASSVARTRVRLRGHGQLLAGDLFEQEGQRSAEDSAGIAVRDLAA